MAVNAFGRWGEDQAAKFLTRQGFKVVDRNFHSLRGEVDIVAVKGDDYYFIEVKTREMGPLATDEAITHFKKRRLASAIKTYLVKRNLSEVGIITAGLLVSANKQTGATKFRLAVFIDKHD